jgi:hypothetical protein
MHLSLLMIGGHSDFGRFLADNSEYLHIVNDGKSL